MDELSNNLTDGERDAFQKCEDVISHGLNTFIDVGMSLLAIRDQRLYRETHSTFEAYCQERWAISRIRAYQFMEAADTVADVKNFLQENNLQVPNEYQARTLTQVAPELRAELWQTALETAPNGRVTAAHVQEVANEYRNKPVPYVSHNSGNNEWYTPPEYIEAARLMLGDIDLDPASSPQANETIKATKYYSIEDDGLRYAWAGKVWMNPPYADGLAEKFANKLVLHYRQRTVKEALVLVNNATETNWFQELARAASAICFPKTRVKFLRPDGEKGSPLQGQAILYLGLEIEAFQTHFEQFGFITEIL